MRNCKLDFIPSFFKLPPMNFFWIGWVSEWILFLTAERTLMAENFLDAPLRPPTDTSAGQINGASG